MGRVQKGILDGFSGKVGTVVGSSWRGISYMRSLPAKKKNQAFTPEQELHQAKFRMASTFVKSLAQLIDDSFQNVAGQTPRNLALGHVINQAIGGIYPALVIDYNEVLVAKGSLKKPSAPAASSMTAGILRFNWINDTGLGNARATDKSILVAYDAETGELVFKLDRADRSTSVADLDVDHLSGKLVQTWMAFRSADKKLISDSIYTGPVMIA